MTPESVIHPALATRHGFFTRRGGHSAGPYASLNCSLSGGDDPAVVSRNRALVAGALGVAPAALVGLTQVHSDVVITVDAAWPEGHGTRGDAMVTATPGVALGVITADCAPVLFADATGSVVGAAHAGWRGAAAGVLEATLAAMVALGARRDEISTVVGPCIGQMSYEVGADLRDAVLPTHPGAVEFFLPGRRPGHWQFDLAGYCAARLSAAGSHATILAADTCADEARFFSHRRRTLTGGGAIGHQISAIRV